MEIIQRQKRKLDIFDQINLDLNNQLFGEEFSEGGYSNSENYTNSEIDEITPAEMGFVRIESLPIAA